LYISAEVLYKIFCFQFFICILPSVLMYSRVCPQSVFPGVLTLRTLRVHAPEPRTARTSGDCDQTWRERGTSGYAAFGIIRRLWQRYGLEKGGATLAKFLFYYQ